MDVHTIEPARLIGGLGVIAAIVMLAAAGPALSQTGPESAPAASNVPYELVEGSTYQTGCFPPCLCPLLDERPLRGTFDLAAMLSADTAYRAFKVANIRWAVLQPDGTTLSITGCGKYLIGTLPDASARVAHRLTLELRIGDQPVQHFDSGLVPGGHEFPRIDIKVSMNNMVCHDTVIHVVARPALPPHLPRHAHFVLRPDNSSVELSLFAGGGTSKLLGTLTLYLGDPDVPVPAVVGMVGLSVTRADLVAPDFEPDVPGIPEPLCMILNPRVASRGAWNTLTGQISFELYLMSANTGSPLVPMPLHLSGMYTCGGLEVSGDNGNVVDAKMAMKISAFEVAPPPPPPPVDLWFSTEVGFGAMGIWPPVDALVHVSDGDLLSWRGHIVRTNHQLTARLGIMPVVPDLGLDAVVRGPRGTIWFSFEEREPIWSETLGTWLKHGDLLSDAGFVVHTNEQLLRRFVGMPPMPDVGLDAVEHAPNGMLLFSTENDFWSEALGRRIGHGDLLSNRGIVVRTNQQLMANYHPTDPWTGTRPPDYGLDAVIVRPNREIWFSTEIGFRDANLGPISDGDLLSDRGYIVIRNLRLVEPFGPVEDVANFGLDAATIVAPPNRCDFDLDGDVDLNDFAHLQLCFNGANRPLRWMGGESNQPEFDTDMDGDGDVDVNDFTEFQACYNGADRPPACE